MAYLMWKHAWGFRQALDFLSRQRPVVSPNGGFMGQLILWEAVLRHAREASQLAPVRLLQVVGHTGSRREPLYVGKEIPRPSRASLDCRGSFVLHCPAQRRAFVWLGSECLRRFVQGAERLCRQLSRRLWVESVSLERQGQESDAFWLALKDCPGPIGHVPANDRVYAQPVPGRVFRFPVWDVVAGGVPGGAAALRDEARRQAWVSYESRSRIVVWVPAGFVVRGRGVSDVSDLRLVVEHVGRCFVADVVGLSVDTAAIVPCSDSDPLVSIALKSAVL
jgi:hypothetical protein